MNTPHNLPDERDFSSPPADPSRPILHSMPPAWQTVYDRFREGHALAVLDAQDKPGDLEAAAILRASTVAVKAFRRVYEEASTASVARQIDEIKE
jgi:hypothetical protein